MSDRKGDLGAQFNPAQKEGSFISIGTDRFDWVSDSRFNLPLGPLTPRAQTDQDRVVLDIAAMRENFARFEDRLNQGDPEALAAQKSYNVLLGKVRDEIGRATAPVKGKKKETDIPIAAARIIDGIVDEKLRYKMGELKYSSYIYEREESDGEGRSWGHLNHFNHPIMVAHTGQDDCKGYSTLKMKIFQDLQQTGVIPARPSYLYVHTSDMGAQDSVNHATFIVMDQAGKPFVFDNDGAPFAQSQRDYVRDISAPLRIPFATYDGENLYLNKSYVNKSPINGRDDDFTTGLGPRTKAVLDSATKQAP